MKSRPIFDVEITRLASGGEGVSSLPGGKTLFIPWAVPGDLAQIEVTEEKPDLARGRILRILERSGHRTDPLCKYFFRCGGCQWQHIDYGAQLEFKTQILKDALQRIAKIAEPFLKPAVASPTPYHYRNRIRLQISRRSEVGFFKPHSKDLIPIETCTIADERLNEKIPEAARLAQRLVAEDRVRRHEIEIRLREDGKAEISAEGGDTSRFPQVNAVQNENLRRVVLDALSLSEAPKKLSVLELFAGEGNFTFAIATQAAEVIAVESAEEAVDRGKMRSRKEHVKNLRWVTATAHRFLEENSNFSVDRLLLDPPRKGAAEIIEKIASKKIPLIVYVSCDPATLARDVKTLVSLGYRHDFSQAIDMFPQTHHVESVTRLVLA